MTYSYENPADYRRYLILVQTDLFGKNPVFITGFSRLQTPEKLKYDNAPHAYIGYDSGNDTVFFTYETDYPGWEEYKYDSATGSYVFQRSNDWSQAVKDQFNISYLQYGKRFFRYSYLWFSRRDNGVGRPGPWSIYKITQTEFYNGNHDNYIYNVIPSYLYSYLGKPEQIFIETTVSGIDFI